MGSLGIFPDCHIALVSQIKPVPGQSVSSDGESVRFHSVGDLMKLGPENKLRGNKKRRRKNKRKRSAPSEAVLLASTLQSVPRNKGKSSLCQKKRHKSPTILLFWQHFTCSWEIGIRFLNNFNAESLSYVIQEATKLSTV